jgi:hypothetical protein
VVVNAILGITALIIFGVAYLTVTGAFSIHLRKSKSVILAADLI